MSASFTSLLKVHHQSKALLRCAKEVLALPEIFISNEDDTIKQRRLLALASQVSDFISQSLSILINSDHQVSSNGRISPKRDKCSRHSAAAAVATAATDNAIASGKRGRISSPTRQQQGDKRQTIASEALSALIFSLQVFRVSKCTYFEIHFSIWQAVLAIGLQIMPPQKLRIDKRDITVLDDQHWDSLYSSLRFIGDVLAMATRVQPPEAFINEIFQALLVTAQDHLHLMRQYPGYDDDNNFILAVAQIGLIYDIHTVNLFLPSCITAQLHLEQFVLLFLETIVMPTLYYYNQLRKHVTTQYSSSNKKSLDELERGQYLLLHVSVQYLHLILVNKIYAMVVMASLTQPNGESCQSDRIIMDNTEEQDLDSNISSIHRNRNRVRETLIELLGDSLVENDTTFGLIQQRICSCLILLFDHEKSHHNTQTKQKTCTKNRRNNMIAFHISPQVNSTIMQPMKNTFNLCQRPYATNITLLFRWIVSVVKYSSFDTTNAGDSVKILEPIHVHGVHISPRDINSKLSSALHLLFSLIKCSGHEPIAVQSWNTFFPVSLDHNTGSITSLILLAPGSLSEERIHYTVLAMTISQEYLKILPHRILISPSNNHGHLWNRVQSSLKCLIDTTHMTLSSCINITQLTSSYHQEIYNNFMIEAGHLIKILVTVIPLSSMDSSEKNLVGSIISLLKIIGQWVTESLTGDGRNFHVIKALLHDLSLAMGGTEQPDGSISPMPIPTQVWFLQDAQECPRDDSFLWTLMNYTQFCLNTKGDPDFHTDVAVDRYYRSKHHLLPNVLLLLISIVRVSYTSLSQTLGCELNQILVSIASALVAQQNISLRLHGSQLIQALFSAERSIVGTHLNSIFQRELLPKLSVLLEDDESDIKRCTLNILGSLTMLQWEFILDGSAHDVFHRVLSLCLEYSGPVSPHVRSDACKAMGNCISTFLAALGPDSDSNLLYRKDKSHLLLDLIDDAVHVSVSCLDDSDAEVRSMALFSIGNIACEALVDCNIRDKRKRLMLKLKDISDIVARRLDDSSDKVIGNAIRTIGHVVHALSECDFDDQEVAYLQNVCVDITVKFSSRIYVALMDVENHHANRTWKQRNFSKKHAWGSCTSLTPMLLFCTKFGTLEYKLICVDALLHVMDCVKLAHVVHEKIASCALSTVLLIEKETWFWIYDIKPSLLGRCIANCLYQYYKQTCVDRTLPSALVDDYMFMIKKGLHFAFDINDEISLTYFLNSEIMSSSMLDYFYQWMVQDGSFSSSCFDCLGGCLIQTHNADNVSLVQKFFSRASFISRVGVYDLEDDEL